MCFSDFSKLFTPVKHSDFLCSEWVLHSCPHVWAIVACPAFRIALQIDIIRPIVVCKRRRAHIKPEIREVTIIRGLEQDVFYTRRVRAIHGILQYTYIGLKLILAPNILLNQDTKCAWRDEQSPSSADGRTCIVSMAVEKTEDKTCYYTLTIHVYLKTLLHTRAPYGVESFPTYHEYRVNGA